MKKITESDSRYNDIEQMSTAEILEKMNAEDQLVPKAVEKVLPELESFLDEALGRMKAGGRLFYIGAGTSGRLGILDASECPPTFGVEHGLVNGLIAGGDDAIRVAVERAEDDEDQGWQDLMKEAITENDVLVGVAASGTTPYVIGAIQKAREHNVLTAGITCNPGSPLDQNAEHAIVPLVGPEFITGSTRLKSGTAQKLLLNMISTRLMIGLGHVEGNKMVDMQLSNQKLVERGSQMIADRCQISISEARTYLEEYGSVRKAVIAFKNKRS
ncbi:MAG: N-acetylmuramic acid 6-phosphate etherase [Bacteroidota bacterium]